MAFEEVGVRAIVKDFGDYNRKLDSMEKKTSGFGSKLGGALRKGALVGGVALAGIGIAGIKMAFDLEKGLAEVRTLLPELSDKGFNKLQADVLALSREMGIATDKIVPALYQAISAGVPRENVIDFLRVGAKASIGGVTDLETAVDGLTTITNAWGLESSEAGRIADVMFTGVKLGKTTMAELSASMFQAAPLAAALGISIEEVVGATATLTKSGVPTAQAMTQMRQAMVALAKPTADMTKLLEKTGFESGEALLEAKGFTGALNILTDAADGNKEVLAKAFGSVEALGFVLATTGDNAKGAAADFAAVTDSAGASEVAFATMEKTASRKLAKALNLLRTALTLIGLKALPIVSKALGALIKLLDPAVKRLGEFLKGGKVAEKQLKKLPKPIRELVRGFRDVLRVGGDLVSFLVSVVRQSKDMADRFRKLPEPLQATAATLSWVVVGFKDLLDVVFSMASPLARIIGMFLDLAVAVAGDVFQDFLEILSLLLNNVIVPLAKQTAAVVTAVSNLGEAFRSNKTAMETAKNILVPLVKAWLLLLAAKKVVNLTQNIVRTGKTFIDFLLLKKNQVQNLTQAIKWSLAKGVTWITDFVKKTQDIVQNVLPRLGKKWITDFAAKTQIITQKVKVELPPGEERLGESFAAGIVFGIGKFFLRQLPVVFAIPIALVGLLISNLALLLISPIGLPLLAGALVFGFRDRVATFFTETLPFLGGVFAGLVFGLFRFGIIALAQGWFDLRKMWMEFQSNLLKIAFTFFTQNLPVAIIEFGPEAVKSIVKSWIESHLEWAKQQVKLGTSAFHFFSEILPREIASGFPNVRLAVRVGLNSVVLLFTEMIPEAATAAFDLGKGIIEGLLSGIGDVAKQVIGPFKKGFEEAISFVKDMLGIQSPSTVFEEIGKDIILGLLGGMSFAFEEVLRFARLIPSKIKEAIGKIDLTPNFNLPDILNIPGIPGIQKGAFKIPQTLLAVLHKGEMVLPRPQAEVVRDVIRAPQPVGIAGLNQLIQILKSGSSGGFEANINVSSEREAASQVELMLRRVAFSMGVSGA